MYFCTNKNVIAMSLLKSILNTVFKSAVESFTQQEERPVRSANVTPKYKPEGEDIIDFPEYFAEILSSEFPQYSTKRDVPVTDLAGLGVVMLGSGNSHSKKVKFLISRMYAKKMGLPYINFYTQLPNERAYVINRIKEFMNA